MHPCISDHILSFSVFIRYQDNKVFVALASGELRVYKRDQGMFGFDYCIFIQTYIHIFMSLPNRCSRVGHLLAPSLS